jgi:hypothetical protein
VSLTQAYLTSTKNLSDIFEAIKGAQAPERFTQRFLVDLGFSSATDRNILGILKAMGFLDDTGAPTQRYFNFLDPAQADHMLALGVREAYEDLFRVNKTAHKLAGPEIKGKMKTLTQGQKSDSVLDKMVLTFTALCSLVNLDAAPPSVALPANDQPSENENADKADDDNQRLGSKSNVSTHSPVMPNTHTGFNLAYDIHIHLPATRDEAVYDALFKSLRQHLS